MITIVTPHYNSHTTLFRILESINILEESIDGLEWIIVDDYSNQESWHNVKDISSNYSYIKAIRLQNNYGPSIARREGVSHAKNDFVCLLDSDDIINVTNFILQFNQIQTLNKEFDFFYHVPIRIIESEYDSSINYHQKEDNTKYKVINNAIDIIKYGLPSMSSLIVNKNFYLNLKTTDENLKWGEDILLYLLMTKYGKGIKFNNSYAMYLINEDGRGSQLKFTYRLNLSIALFKQALVGPRKTESMFYSLFYSARYFSTYILKKLNLIR